MTDAADPTATLRRLRGSIDNIDAALIFMLAERFKATQQVGVLKAEHGMPASDPAREEQQIARLRRLAPTPTSTRVRREVVQLRRRRGDPPPHGGGRGA
jgi:monofunctional chorismate mutase